MSNYEPFNNDFSMDEIYEGNKCSLNFEDKYDNEIFEIYFNLKEQCYINGFLLFDNLDLFYFNDTFLKSLTDNDQSNVIKSNFDIKDKIYNDSFKLFKYLEEFDDEDFYFIKQLYYKYFYYPIIYQLRKKIEFGDFLNLLKKKSSFL
jgi:hypothetical protein